MTSATERIYSKGLRTLDPNGRPCEVCGELMPNHDWVDLDIDGFVVVCSNQSATDYH
jgi:hypothetical protein